MRYLPVPHSAHTARSAGRPFFIVARSTSGDGVLANTSGSRFLHSPKVWTSPLAPQAGVNPITASVDFLLMVYDSVTS